MSAFQRWDPPREWADWRRDDKRAAVALAATLRGRGHSVVMHQEHVLITRAPDGVEHGWHVRDVGPHAPWSVSRVVLLSMLAWRAESERRVAWLVHVAQHANAPRRGVWVCGAQDWINAAMAWDSTCEPLAIDAGAWRRVDDVC